MDQNKESKDDSSLESQESDSNSLEGGSSATSSSTAAPEPAKKKGGNKVRSIISHVNVYLLLFIFIVVLAVGIILVGMQKNKKAAVVTTITTQPLSQADIDKLKDSEAKVGDPKQTLTIESNAIFSGKVLIRDSLDVAGGIKIGSALSLPGLTVSGSSNFDQLLANTLTIAGGANIQGQLNVAKGINTTGGGSFGGPITAPSISIQTLQLSGDLPVTRHIDAGGGTPGKSDGTALGSGGTSSVSGTDTAGTVTINTGGAPGGGCFVTITFSIRFNSTPHVVVTPVGSAAGGLNFYINRSSSSFSICTSNTPPAGQTFSFDYIAID